MKVIGSIKIDGVEYGAQEDFGGLITECEGIQAQIFEFLKEWFSPSTEIMVFTSGSTGKPKKLNLNKNVMRKSARATCEYFSLDSGSIIHLCLPVSFIAGKMMLVRGIISGANVVVEEPVVSPMLAYPGPISLSAMTPAQVNKVLSDDQGRLNDVKNLIIGGAPVGMDLEDQLQHFKTNCYSTFGMTETATHVALMRLNGKNKSDVFRAVGDVTFRMDDSMCLVINSESLGLSNLITNDIVEIVDDRSFRWIGRQDHVINTGGIKVFPEQIEKKMGHTLNGNFFFAAMPDDQFGEIVILLVEGKERQLDLTVLSKFEQPKRVYFVEHFSFTGSGKIDRKKVLKELLDA